MSFLLQGTMPMETFRHIIDVNKPYDTGRMFLRGTRYTETPDFIKATYDMIAVPYIFYQERGTKFFEGNKGFISVKTINHLNQVAVYGQTGQQNVALQDTAKRKSMMISQGVMEELKGYGKEVATGNAYFG